MAQAQGSRSKVVIDFETTFATDPVTKAGKVLNFNKASMTGKQNLITPSTITGNRNPVQPQRGFVDVSGGITVPVDLIGTGYILKALFGAPTTTGAADYTHIFKPGTTQPSMIIEQQFPDISVYNKYNGCKASKYSLSIGGDGELTQSLDFMGAKETVGASVYDASASAIVATMFSNPQISLEEGGTAFAYAKSLDLNIDMGLDGDTYVINGTGFRGSVNEGIIDISGTLRCLFLDNVMLNKAVNGTTSSLKIIATIAANKSLEIYLPEVIYERNAPGIDGPKGIMIDLPFKAYFASNAESTSIKVTLKNQTASYA
jgi:hypothetical protein